MKVRVIWDDDDAVLIMITTIGDVWIPCGALSQTEGWSYHSNGTKRIEWLWVCEAPECSSKCNKAMTSDLKTFMAITSDR